MADDLKLDLVRIQERVGALSQTVDKAHTRIDGLSADVKADLVFIAADIKILLANMHQQKGSEISWKTMLTIAGLAVGLLGALAKIYFS